MELKPMPFLGDYFGGQFVRSERPDGEFSKLSPADLSDRVLDTEYKYDHLEPACEAAKRAFREWSTISSEERITHVNRIKEQYEKNQDLLAETISRETGKPLWEAMTEVKAMIGKFGVTINDSLKLVAEVEIQNALPGVTGRVRYRPRGVMAVIGPFNFPGHLPNGHIVPALVTGNTVVFKPSELTPATGQLMAELIHRAGLPAGVFNLVQGPAEMGKRLVDSSLVDGILFTGSYDVGLKIKEKTLTHFWKILALEMGGKNATIIWDDADLNKAIQECLVGAFISAGQRCSCTSRIIVHKQMVDQFTERFYQAAKKLKVGHWRDQVFMGPLISEGSVEKYLRFQEIGLREGAEKVMRGKALDLEKKGHYVTPSIYRVNEFNPQSVYQTNEIFGPNVMIYSVDDFDEALHINDAPGFGLVLSVFSKNRKYFDEAAQKARVGNVNWNRTTNGASSRLPFGGLGKSGNDRPSAHFAVYYCTVPVASLEDESPFAKAEFPGFNYEPS